MPPRRDVNAKFLSAVKHHGATITRHKNVISISRLGARGRGGGGARFSEPHDMLTSNASEPADLHRKSMLTCPRL